MSRRFTIGRDTSCDVPIADDSVSRLHAEIWLAEDGKVMMADRGSSNGTTLIRADESFPLKHSVVMPSDQVRLGAFTLAVMDLIEVIELKNPGTFTANSKTVGASAVPGPLLRCECGAIKTSDQVCPGCHR